jgi:hypothetical protein
MHSSLRARRANHGDANVSGSVTFDDYVRTDTGFNARLPGWSNGDFSYSRGRAPRRLRSHRHVS